MLSTVALNENAKVSNQSNDSANKTVNLYASVCVERMPVITCDMNDLEKRYSNLINEINIRRSLLSNHELRHLKDLERASKRKNPMSKKSLLLKQP